MLFRKLLRDLVRFKGQFVAIVILVTLGVCLFSGFNGAYIDLNDSAENSFDRLHLADYTVSFTSAPAAVAEEARRIEGVRMAAGRYVDDASLELAGVPDRMQARLISLPGPDEDPVNSLHLMQGALPEPGERLGVVITNDFALHHGLEPGDTVHVLVEGLRQELVIRGLVLSPEYLFATPDLGGFFADMYNFAVLFAHRDTVAEVLGSGDQINEIVVTAVPGADLAQMREDLRELASGYGLRTIVAREDQFSYRMLEMELEQLSEWSVALPMVFLGAAVMIILVLMARIIGQQRPHIGLLRALGYTRGQVLRYYLSFAFLVGAVGSALGVAFGYWMSAAFTELYAMYFNLPYLVGAFHWDVQAKAVALGLGSCLAASYFSARRAAGIRPVEAMRPLAPPPGRRFWGERVLGLDKLPVTWKFPLRNITRNPWRFNFAALGVGIALSLLVMTGAFYDHFDNMMNQFFGEQVAWEAQVTFVGPTGWAAVHQVRSWPETDRVEGLAEVAVRFKNGHLEWEGTVTGLEPDTRLYGLRDADGRPLVPVPGGVLLSENLLDILDLRVGETVTLQPMLEGLPPLDVPVAGTARMTIGAGGFMLIEEARFLTGPGTPISGALVTMQPGYHPTDLRERLREAPFVVGVQDPESAREQVLEMLDMVYAFIGTATIFAMLLAGAMVYAMASISSLERVRELATMRLQGMTRRGTGALMAAEGVLPAPPGFVLGVLIGYGLAGFMAAAWSSDLMTLRMVIYPSTLVISVVVTSIAVGLAQIPAVRNVNRVNLAEASKNRE